MFVDGFYFVLTQLNLASNVIQLSLNILKSTACAFAGGGESEKKINFFLKYFIKLFDGNRISLSCQESKPAGIDRILASRSGTWRDLAKKNEKHSLAIQSKIERERRREQEWKCEKNFHTVFTTAALLWRCVYVFLPFSSRLELEVDRIHVDSLLSLLKERVVLKQEEKKKWRFARFSRDIYLCVCQCGVAVGGSRSIIFSIESWSDTRLKISPSRLLRTSP